MIIFGHFSRFLASFKISFSSLHPILDPFPYLTVFSFVQDLCRELISRWSRPIYGLNDNYQSMTREAREARDFELLPKAKKRRLKEAADGRSDKTQEESKAEPKPGRKGFVMRARVPMPSNQDYVVRPKVSQTDHLDSRLLRVSSLFRVSSLSRELTLYLVTSGMLTVPIRTRSRQTTKSRAAAKKRLATSRRRSPWPKSASTDS